jgi:hypothetical protein
MVKPAVTIKTSQPDKMPPAVMVKTHHHRIKCHTVSDEQFITTESNDVLVAAPAKAKALCETYNGGLYVVKIILFNPWSHIFI